VLPILTSKGELISKIHKKDKNFKEKKRENGEPIKQKRATKKNRNKTNERGKRKT